MKVIRYKTSRIKGKFAVSCNKCKRKKNVRLWKGGVCKMSAVIEKPVKMGAMARMKQMAQEGMKANGMTEKDVRKILGIQKYEQD